MGVKICSSINDARTNEYSSTKEQGWFISLLYT